MGEDNTNVRDRRVVAQVELASVRFRLALVCDTAHFGRQAALGRWALHRKRGYVLIDGMRGIAALAVASLHWQAMSAPWLFASSGGLAVDLFFLLSGIVIAHAYDERIDQGDLNAVRFMLTRIIRFWPLYALGTLLGAAAVCVALATGRDSYYHSYGELGISVALTLLFIPQRWGGALFELNPLSGRFFGSWWPTWRLSFFGAASRSEY